MADLDLLDYGTASGLLQDQDSLHHAESQRPWSASLIRRQFEPNRAAQHLNGRPLLRTYDGRSGSVPDWPTGRMQARAPRTSLGTQQSRLESLRTHANFMDWYDTPFISFFSCPIALAQMAEKRQHGWSRSGKARGPQNIVVIDPECCLDRQLPIIEFVEEMKYYGVDDPYKRNFEYYAEEYLCLWEVTPDEVVGIWSWDELGEVEDWYENIILPAVERHRADFFAGRLDASPTSDSEDELEPDVSDHEDSDFDQQSDHNSENGETRTPDELEQVHEVLQDGKLENLFGDLAL